MNENFEKLIKLHNEDPDLPIIPMVDSDVVCSNEFSFFKGEIGTCGIRDYAEWKDRIYTDKDSLIDDIIDEEYYFSEESDEVVLKKATAKADKLMSKVIILIIKP